MRKLLRVGKDVKALRARVKELMRLKINELEMDPKLPLIQELIPLGLIHVGEPLTEELKALAGDRYKRKGTPGHLRWAKQWGSGSIGEQKLSLQEPHRLDEGLPTKILIGLKLEALPRVQRVKGDVGSKTIFESRNRFDSVQKNAYHCLSINRFGTNVPFYGSRR
jgi:hypothetical protein